MGLPLSPPKTSPSSSVVVQTPRIETIHRFILQYSTSCQPKSDVIAMGDVSYRRQTASDVERSDFPWSGIHSYFQRPSRASSLISFDPSSISPGVPTNGHRIGL